MTLNPLVQILKKKTSEETRPDRTAERFITWIQEHYKNLEELICSSIKIYEEIFIILQEA